MRPWTPCRDGILLTLRLAPKSGRDGIDGMERLADGREVLKVRVRAAPSDGEANAALVALIAKALGLPRARVSIVAGATARLKRVRILGDAAALAAALETMTPPDGAQS